VKIAVVRFKPRAINRLKLGVLINIGEGNLYTSSSGRRNLLRLLLLLIFDIVIMAIISYDGNRSGYKSNYNIINKSRSRSSNNNRRLFLKEGFKE
jgi:hypothetical protein